MVPRTLNLGDMSVSISGGVSWSDSRSKVVSQSTSSNTSDETTRVANGQQILGHIRMSMVLREKRDVVERDQHSA